ncbi:bacterioferritin [Thauera sp. CAU 1555]|uniref:Bacterioferritin n=1 Tax=Thauera sedimentorum TaxID=2767595 RepID=A0ABR9BDG5_9RHOO|nr:bacterioferritin [Thauera sedimentorum]MBC9073134.1 bacterioferritin [Thauera sedimentorum]MBD8504053.1 bacterioferritin [Thauera sedimentorum]
MKGNKKVIAALNALLADELAARDQYFIHSRMLSEWGLAKAAERIAHEMEDETQHADALIRRILFLEGVPAMSPSKLTVGKDLPDIFTKDLAVEMLVVKNLREAIALCEAEQDYVTREILEKMLDDTEEDHAHWLEQQLGLIKLVGLQNYLQSQMAG